MNHKQYLEKRGDLLDMAYNRLQDTFTAWKESNGEANRSYPVQYIIADLMRFDLGCEDLPFLVEDAFEDLLRSINDDLEGDYVSNGDMLEAITREENDGDKINEIADNHTPIYYYDLEKLHYLYSSELEEAYENHGFDAVRHDNFRAVAVCLYLEDKLRERLKEARHKLEDVDYFDEQEVFDIEAFISSFNV